ncbi:hypothetical protein ASALC70_01784 [Alcanivorax sp. ALC70]|nr:DNA repair protein [Alcanivorax sp. ZXX171]UWN49571.1 hypothetical protein ASALC70_01784 [Alcanivorax sp. ALC70]|tara:strand:- start:450 stop:1148 length:699 start_codon:yes stop_codon:yes gene_type:complete
MNKTQEPSKVLKAPRRVGAPILAGLLLALSLPAIAQTDQSLEQRLRAELRNTRQELQTLRSNQARLENRVSQAEAERQAALDQLAALRARLEASQGRLQSQQRASRGRLEESRQQNQKVRAAYDELLEMARDKEAQRRQLAQRAQAQADALETCVARNDALFKAGREILDAYESLGAGSLFRMRQPLAASARVEFENRAQDFGDRLYNNQVGATAPEDQPTPSQSEERDTNE